MAHPVFSFIHPEDKKRYFFIWDTYYGMPETIPMNLLNLLQFYGLENYPQVEAVYNCYPDLLKNGTSLPEDSFDLTNENIKRLIYENVRFSKVNDTYEAVSQKLEDLFLLRMTMDKFRLAYAELTKNLNIYPPYPFHYYRFLSFTSKNLYGAVKENFYFTEIIVKYCKANGTDVLIEVDDWITGGYVLNQKGLMSKLFFELAKINIIDISAIPHIYRTDSPIKDLFINYDFGDILPKNEIKYDIYKRYKAAFKIVEMTKSVCAQILNNQMHEFSRHDFNCQIPYNLISKENDLEDIISQAYYSSRKFVNFYDDQGAALHPQGLFLTNIQDIKNFYVLGINIFELQSIFHSNGFATDLGALEEIQYFEHDSFAVDNPCRLIKFDSENKRFLSIHLNYNPVYTKVKLFDSLNAYFVKSGFIHINGEIITPFCMSDCGDLAEDMIAFEMNGKWGYLNKDFKIAIPPSFGSAMSFRQGLAKVFLFNEEYIHFDENWIELPSWIPKGEPVNYELNEALFKAKFPDFPDTYRFNLINNDDDSFGKKSRSAPDPNKGFFALIDKKGEIISIEDCFVEQFGENHINHEFEIDDDYMIKVTSLPEDLLAELNNYDYRTINARNKEIDKPLTEAFKQKIIDELVAEKKYYRKLPLAVQKDIDFLIELMEKELLDGFPFYLLYQDKFAEVALRKQQYSYYKLPWAMREKYSEIQKEIEKLNEREDGLPF